MAPIRSRPAGTTSRMGGRIIYFDLQPPRLEDRNRHKKDERDTVREELRADWNAELRRLTGDPDARLWWATEKFARLIVWELGYTWAGWPADIPFQNLSDIPGGAAPLLRLQSLWKAGTLKLVRASTQERMRALHYPESVVPNAQNALPVPQGAAGGHPLTIIQKRAARFRELARQIPAPPEPLPAPSQAVEHVLHPLSDLRPVLARPLDTVNTSHAQPCARRQRSDINVPRARPVTNRRPKHPKRGPHTALMIVEGKAASEWQGNYMFVDDRIDGYVPPTEEQEEEIESADDWA